VSSFRLCHHFALPALMMDTTENVTIPVIDISDLFCQDTNARGRLAKEWQEACSTQGFMQIVGHQVRPEVITSFQQASKAFFQLPIEVKNKYAWASDHHRGYERMRLQKLEQFDPALTLPDEKEGFTIRKDTPSGTRMLQGVNRWPLEECPLFCSTFEAYFEELHRLSVRLFQLMAVSLGLDQDHFDEFSSDADGIITARVMHYPPVDTSSSVIRPPGAGAHTDFGAMTVLLQDDVGGLQVLHRDTKEWIDVTFVKDALVVNIGDLMERWTNGRYKSTIHRVKANESGKDRYSCAFFNEGILDMVISCLPTCKGEGKRVASSVQVATDTSTYMPNDTLHPS
jgi:isopenicillin N synthase-like dioxygenase